MSSWGCPHELGDKCMRVNEVPCEPGMRGCVLYGRFVWADETKNRPSGQRSSKKPELPQRLNDTKEVE